MQRSPVFCKVRRWGESVEFLGVRTSVLAAPIREADAPLAARLVRALVPFQSRVAADYRCVLLSSSNQLIHPARMFALRDEALAPGLRFYADWNEAASTVLLGLHAEMHALRTVLRVPVRLAPTLLDRRPVPGARQLTMELRRQRSLHELLVPTLPAMDRYSLDRGHRFFREDIGEGLSSIVSTAEAHGVEMPLAARIVSWYSEDTAVAARIGLAC
jgi:hypothetical protein